MRRLKQNDIYQEDMANITHVALRRLRDNLWVTYGDKLHNIMQYLVLVFSDISKTRKNYEFV